MGKIRKAQIPNIPIDAALVAETPGWKLLERVSRSAKGWRNLKLIAMGRNVKANYSFGWNGSRFSDSRDWILLQAHEPEIAAWCKDVAHDRLA